MIDAAVINLLPYDGDVNYYGAVLPLDKADEYFKNLLQTIVWKHEEAVVYGRRIVTKRMVAWYGDKPFAYTYSGVTKEALPWSIELQQLKRLTEEKTSEPFNSCLLNLYHNGSESMGWHSDNETTLQPKAAIASLSLGAERRFSFRHKQTKEVVSVNLANGSLLLMKGVTQMHWHHSLPKALRIKEARINLTFRNMKES